jgi:hypothetical protein
MWAAVPKLGAKTVTLYQIDANVEVTTCAGKGRSFLAERPPQRYVWLLAGCLPQRMLPTYSSISFGLYTNPTGDHHLVIRLRP